MKVRFNKYKKEYRLKRTIIVSYAVSLEEKKNIIELVHGTKENEKQC